MNYIDIFLEALAAERGRSEKTLMGYASDLAQADAALPNGLMNATESDIQNFLSNLPDKASSIARKASALRGFYKFLMLEKIITTNPTKNIELPKRTRPLPKLLSVDEIDLLISSAGDIKTSTRLRAMLELVYASGLRVSELCELPMTAILGDHLLIHGKGAKERMVPMHAGAINALNKWLDARGDID
ncbi:MAG: site-specific integrase, partial [Alphaproteobacteria bacterium]|nr:site-specific integrase [Alphaproteobacteria bacterium]